MIDKAKAVVIGAGMGGLSAAIRLNAMGFSVTVVEMSDVPGGKARAVPSAAGLVDTGPTVLTLRHHVDDLFTLCGTRTDDHVDLIPLPRLARHFWRDGSQLDLYPDPEANAEAIDAFAGPREADAFRHFDRLASTLYEAFEGPMMQAAEPRLGSIARAAIARPRIWPALLPGVTMDRLLRRAFRDPRLVQLFGRYSTYVGGRPAFTPGVMSLVWRAEAAGVWGIAGGMNALAKALAGAAENAGVRFIYNVQARRILRQGGQVSAVELDGHPSLPCTTCVFNGDPEALRANLLGDAAHAAFAKSPKVRPSLSAWVWAFAAEAHGPDLAHHNVFFTDDPAKEFGPIGQGDMPETATLYVCAQDRDLGRPVPQLERFEIIMNAPAGFESDATEETRCRHRSFPPLRAMGLTFSPEPERTALTTPSLLAQLYPGTKGALYGASPEGMMAAFRRPKTRTALKGLYLAGGGTHPGAGVPMALLSGQHAAWAIAEDRTSALTSAPTATPGGISTASHPAAPARSR